MISTPIRTSALYSAEDMSAIETGTFLGGEVAFVSARSPEKETPNEDSMAFIPLAEDCGVLAVADGVGGLPGGDQASQLALVELVAALEGADRDGDGWMRDAILNGIENANRSVLALDGAATTLAVAEISREIVRSYHIGDSLVLVTGQRGRIKHEAVPHSPVGYALHAGLMEEEEAMAHEDRNLISNVIGSEEMRIEIGPALELSPRDTLLLASDGLSDNLYAREIVDWVRKGKLADSGEKLFSICRQRMQTYENGQPSKPDDLTFVAYRPAAAGRVTPAP